MSFSAESTIHPDYLLMKLKGRITGFEEFINLTNTIVEEQERTNRKNILLDHRDFTAKVDYFDLVRMSDHVRERRIPSKGFRTACVYEGDDKAPPKLYETPAANRSQIFRAFRDEDEALQWLLGS